MSTLIPQSQQHVTKLTEAQAHAFSGHSFMTNWLQREQQRLETELALLASKLDYVRGALAHVTQDFAAHVARDIPGVDILHEPFAFDAATRQLTHPHHEPAPSEPTPEPETPADAPDVSLDDLALSRPEPSVSTESE